MIRFNWRIMILYTQWFETASEDKLPMGNALELMHL